jgi:hypothetical protein
VQLKVATGHPESKRPILALSHINGWTLTGRSESTERRQDIIGEVGVTERAENATLRGPFAYFYRSM